MKRRSNIVLGRNLFRRKGVGQKRNRSEQGGGRRQNVIGSAREGILLKSFASYRQSVAKERMGGPAREKGQ